MCPPSSWTLDTSQVWISPNVEGFWLLLMPLVKFVSGTPRMAHAIIPSSALVQVEVLQHSGLMGPFLPVVYLMALWQHAIFWMVAFQVILGNLCVIFVNVKSCQITNLLPTSQQVELSKEQVTDRPIVSLSYQPFNRMLAIGSPTKVRLYVKCRFESYSSEM